MDEIKKTYYRIAEVADIVCVSTPQVRLFCRQYGIEPKRDRGGNRKFTEDQLFLLRWIANLNRMSRADLIKNIMRTDLPQTALNLTRI